MVVREWIDITRISGTSDYGTGPKRLLHCRDGKTKLDEKVGWEEKEDLNGGATTCLIYQTPEVSFAQRSRLAVGWRRLIETED